MSKTVCVFKSPYHDQYGESHAGGRSALSLRFADLDALVIRGKAPTPSCLSVGSRYLDLRDVHFLWGMDLLKIGKMLRRVEVVTQQFASALHLDDIVLGGGNARKLTSLPQGCRMGDNANAFLGGFRLWEEGGGRQ